MINCFLRGLSDPRIIGARFCGGTKDLSYVQAHRHSLVAFINREFKSGARKFSFFLHMLDRSSVFADNLDNDRGS
ncbi:hypothetical protein QT972_18460 [Microcoleus sp. herbarium7]